MNKVKSDEALGLILKVASGQAVPQRKDCSQRWDDLTLDWLVEGWTKAIFTDVTRSKHVDSVTSPDGRHGEARDWESDTEFSQQPEDRLYREDSNGVDRMFQAFRRAQ